MCDQELHVIFIRHGRTTDNAKGVVSGGAADPDLLPEGQEQARAANNVYKALEAKGLVNDNTAVFTSDRTRAIDTAKFFTGRNNAENFTIDQRLLERLLGDWDSKLTERLQKEFKAIKGFAPPAEETPAEHKAHVNEFLDESIRASDGTPFIVVSHGGTTRRIAAYFGIEEGLEVQNAVPHHAVSKDGGRSWEIKKLAVDTNGALKEEVLPKELPKKASTARTMLSILEEHVGNISISGGILTISSGSSDAEQTALADDLGQMLIGKSYTDEGAVSVEGSRVVVKLDDVQSEIITTFAKLSGAKVHDAPSVLALSRGNMPAHAGTSAEAVSRGAYTLEETVSGSSPKVVLVATGSEVQLAVVAKKALLEEGISATVVSMPCQEFFEQQPLDYKLSVFPDGVPVLSVEASGVRGWERYSHLAVGMSGYGASGPASALYAKFGFTTENIVAQAKGLTHFYSGRSAPSLVNRPMSSFVVSKVH